MADQEILDVRRQLEEGGFTPQEINTHLYNEHAPVLREGGFSEAEIQDYIGKPQAKDENVIREFFKRSAQELIGLGDESVPSIDQYLTAGFQESVTGLAVRGKLPDVKLPDNSPFVQSVAKSAVMMVGDLPAMAGGYMLGLPAGTAAGGAVGTAVAPGPGTAVGAAVGGQTVGFGMAFAMPEALRTALVDGYKDGSIDSFEEFWSRVTNVGVRSAKAFTVGAVSRGAGLGAGAVTTKVGGTLATKEMAMLAAEVPTMVTLGAAMEGEVPEPEDFAHAAILLLGARGVQKGTAYANNKAREVKSKVFDVYAKTGKSPAEVAREASVDLTIKEDLLGKSKGIPRSYERLKTPKPPEQAKAQPAPPSAELANARKAVGERISVGEKETSKISLNEIRRQFIDELAPLDKAIKALNKELPAEANPVLLARTSKTMGRTQHFLNYGTFDFFTAKNNGASLQQVLKPVAKDLSGFREYIVAKRALKISQTRFTEVDGKQKAMDTGVPLDAAKLVVKNAPPEWQAAAKELSDYNRRTLAYMRDSGMLSKENFDALLKLDDFYIPFNRVMDAPTKTGATGPGKDSLNLFNPVRNIKGSGRKIVDPLESVIKNTHTYIQLAERNRTLTALADTSKVAGAPVKKIKPPFKMTEVKADELNRFFKDQGIKVSEDMTLEVFRPNPAGLKENQFVIFRNGKREYYETTPEIAEALRSTASVDVNPLIEILAAPAKLRRAGVTLEAAFQAKNFFRDNFVAGVQSKNAFIPFVDGLAGLTHVIRRGDVYQEWLKSGGAQSALVSMDRKYLNNELYKITKNHKVRNAASTPIEIMRGLMEAVENAPRVGEFAKARKKGKSLRQAGADSREVSVDFGRQPGSATVKTMTRLNAFLNARIQGYDRLFRAFKENPVATSAKLSGMIILPSVATHLTHYERDKEGNLRLKQWYKDLPDWVKDTHWVLNVGTESSPTIIRLPKPFELGILFGTGSERFMDFMLEKDAGAFESMSEFLLGSIADPGALIPDAVEPFVEVATNQSLFTGAPLVPMSMENLLPEFQVKPYTTELTKSLAQAIATVPAFEDTPLASPIVLDNFVRSWGGTLGVQVRDMLDASLRSAGVLKQPPPQPADTLADVPAVGAFIVRNPSMGMQPIIDFYNQYTKNEKRLRTLDKLKKSGELTSFVEQRERALLKGELTDLKKFKDTLKKVSDAVFMVWNHPDIDPVEKRQLIDEYYKAALDVAKAGNELQKKSAEAQRRAAQQP